jgi:hypothetical protein
MGVAIRWPWVFEELGIDLSEDEPVSSRFEIITDWMTEQFAVDQEDINSGYCFIWAFLAYASTTGTTLHDDSDEKLDHAFISYRGRVYDSEHLDGVAVERALDKHPWGDILPRKVEYFCQTWCDIGRRRVAFKELLTQLWRYERRAHRRNISSWGLDFLK